MRIFIERVSLGRVPDLLVPMIPFMFVREEEACWMSEIIVAVVISLIALTTMKTTHQIYEFYLLAINFVNKNK